jgi:polysaccharide biosynthesis transport protein
VPGEGKSTTAANLAFSLGQMHKVLLVEGDLRRPTQRKNFDLPVGTSGVANYLAGTAELDDCIKSIEGAIDLITAGTVPPNPQELISSGRFREMIDVLKERYDFILIDSPPSLAVSDAAVLGTTADAVLYVVRSQSTQISLAQRGVGQLLQKNAPIVGVVLNRVDIRKAHKYGYSYGGYYDYYGYSDEKAG